MNNVIGVIGQILMYLTGLLFVFGGLLMMNTYWGIGGVVIGIFLFPIPFLMGLITIFTSWGAFIGSVIWFSLIAMMIYIGEDN